MTDPANTSQHPRSTLAQKRVADALCDQFEEAWRNGQRPAIETLLAAVPPADRRAVFRELLLTELALCRDDGQPTPLDQYAQRFAEYRDIVGEIVKQPAGSVAGNLRSAVGEARLIQCVRARLENNPGPGHEHAHAPTMITGNSQPARGSQDALELWRLLIEHASLPGEAAHRDDDHRAERVENMARELLGVFPVVRQRVVLGLMLGWSVREVAIEQRVTERTAAMTYQTALDLLRRRPQ